MNGSPSGKLTRSSLACLPCRSRHLKCDGKQPSCSRCANSATECNYTRSRRGGLDRAALAERRKRLSRECPDVTTAATSPSPQRSIDARQGGQHVDQYGIADSPRIGVLLGSNRSNRSFDTSSTSSIQLQVDSLEGDALTDAYYKHFHKLHPFILPQKHLTRLYQDPRRQPRYRPLIAVVRLVGYIVNSREWSLPLKDHTETCFSQAPEDPIMVQCRLLYSMMLFWYGHTADSKHEMDAAVRLAVDLEMFRQAFAVEHGDEDPVLQESWRRTWWMLCIADVYYAGTLGTTKFVAVNIEATVDMPCEEWEYESGEIPEPKTLQDFESREFDPDATVFSSFAYLVGAVRCEALAMSTAPKSASREGSTQVIQIADSLLESWLLLLPKDRKQVMTPTGEVDELMFQAHMLIQIATISMHRPFSDLPFNPVEDVSSCAREPAQPNTTASEMVNVHTIRVLRAVEAQVRLLALPDRQFTHTPFATCMVNGGILALLSASNFLLKGIDLQVARGQIRMMIGHLKILAETWPRTMKNLREIQTISRHVLGLQTRTVGSSTLSPVPSEVRPISAIDGRDTARVSNNMGILSSPGTIEDLAGWCSPGLDLDFLWGVCNDSEYTI